jgi:hypothetical protein
LCATVSPVTQISIISQTQGSKDKKFFSALGLDFCGEIERAKTAPIFILRFSWPIFVAFPCCFFLYRQYYFFLFSPLTPSLPPSLYSFVAKKGFVLRRRVFSLAAALFVFSSSCTKIFLYESSCNDLKSGGFCHLPN